MDYYVRTVRDGFTLYEDFWAVAEDVAYQGIMQTPIGTHLPDSGEDILTTLHKRFPGSQFHKLTLGPGEYYPRMARPFSTLVECSPGVNPDKSRTAHNVRTTSTGQLHALIQGLQEICQAVHPKKANFGTYGHTIRNIIIIACTEVEAHWKNVLAANGQRGKDRHDYVKLAPVMRLGEYRVAMSWYPWLQPRVPFRKWKPMKPGEKQHLPWFDAYNAIKHDRERHFTEAKLEHALNAVAACFVMLCAQYGWDFAKQGEAAEGAFFRLIEAPRWEPSEIYVPPFGTAHLLTQSAAELVKRPHSFDI